MTKSEYLTDGKDGVNKETFRELFENSAGVIDRYTMLKLGGVGATHLTAYVQALKDFAKEVIVEADEILKEASKLN